MPILLRLHSIKHRVRERKSNNSVYARYANSGRFALTDIIIAGILMMAEGALSEYTLL